MSKPAVAVRNINLTIDGREHAMLNFLREHPEYTQIQKIVRGVTYAINIDEQVLPAGDYAITYEGTLLALFERKTFPDYAASIRDGRNDNKDYMKEARIKTRCDLHYIIEEDPNKNLTLNSLEMGVFTGQFRTFTIGGLPASSILASISHLVSRDKIFVSTTAGIAGTFMKLANLCISYATTEKSTIQQNAQATFAIIAGERKLADDEILRQMFITIPHIHENNVRDLVGYTFAAAVIAPPTSLPTRARNNLLSVPTTSRWLTAIAAIPGISASFITAILKSEVTYQQVIEMSDETRTKLLLALDKKTSSRLDQIHRLLTTTRL